MKESNNIFKFLDELHLTMHENEDSFILEMIQPYCEGVMNCTLPKEAIKQALLTYSQEHSEEWNTLLKTYRKEQT